MEGKAEVLAAVLALLKDEKDPLPLRAYAVESLPERVEKGSADAVALAKEIAPFLPCLIGKSSAAVLAEDCCKENQDHSCRKLLTQRIYFRTKAIKALAELANNKGNSEVMGVVLALLKDEGVDEAMFSRLFSGCFLAHEAQAIIRIRALAELAKEGSAEVIAAVSALRDKWKQKPALKDQWEEARKAAIKTLGELVKKGIRTRPDEETLTKIVGDLACDLDDEDPGPFFRNAALEALFQLAEGGDVNKVKVIAAVSDRLKNRSHFVRQAAIDGLVELAGKGSTQVIGAVLDCLGDGHYFVRETAIRALAQLAEKGNMKVIAAISAKKNVDEEEDPFVRDAATKAVAQLELV